MKKILLSGMLLLGLHSQAQLASGSIATDFTMTDINGTTHNLYTYLNAGKTVFLDISATWCGPCWSYHNTNALEDLWVNHGPTGGTNVSSSTTNDVIVIFIEGDPSTGSAQLNGSAGSQGDWVSGVSHPICDPSDPAITEFEIDYAISYFPTIYKICPNRQVFEVGSVSATSLYNSVSSCISFSGANNPALIGYVGETSSCGAIAVNVTLQNMGAMNLTAATIALKQGSTVINTVNWTGNLGTYQTTDVALGSVTPIGSTTYTIEITSPDDVTSNNVITQTLSSYPGATTAAITVQIITDAFGSDNSWELKNSSGTTVASGGPYSDVSASGAIVQPPVTYTTPTAGECYEFILYDDYGDGMVTDFGTGSYTVKDGANNVLLSGGAFEATEVSGKFLSGSGGTGSGAAIDELAKQEFHVYPNPATDQIQVQFDAVNTDYTISLIDLSGRTILSNTYSNLAGNQSVTLPVNEVSGGNYIVKIACEGFTFNEKVVITIVR